VGRPPSTGSEDASIVVLPFRSLSADPEDGYLAEGIASELQGALTGVPGLRIASHLAAFKLQEHAGDPMRVAAELNSRYVVSGTVRRSAQRVRVSAELFDAVQKTVAWSRKYDRVLTDIFEMQEDISRSIVGSLGGQFIRANTDFAYRTPTSNLDAWGLARKAYHIWNYQFSVAGVAEAVGLLKRAVELDPGYAAAHAYLGMYLIQAAIHHLSSDSQADRRLARESVERACQLAPSDPVVLENACIVFLHSGEYQRAVQCGRRAVDLAPYDLVAWGYLGFAHASAGGVKEAGDALKILSHLIGDAPDHPSMAYWLHFVTLATLRLERYQEAVEYGRRCFDLQPGFVFQQVLLAEALCRLDRIDEAKTVLATIPAYNPYFSMAAFEEVANTSCRSPAIVEQFCGRVKSLGLFN
jgi:adenylate cyclase